MANIKISELEELEQVDNDDLLVIVDTSANETKKVKARNVGTGGGSSDVVIISDTQPTSEDNKIWIDTGEVGESFTEITNEYSTSTGKGYSANYMNDKLDTIDTSINDLQRYTKITSGYLPYQTKANLITLPYNTGHHQYILIGNISYANTDIYQQLVLSVIQYGTSIAYTKIVGANQFALTNTGITIECTQSYANSNLRFFGTLLVLQ